MALLGVQTLIYGVDNLDEAARFYDDLGLVAQHRADDGLDYVLEDGSTLLLRCNDGLALSPSLSDAPGVREVIWGVDSQAALDELETSLSTDRKVSRDVDGTLHTHDDCGIADCPSPRNGACRCDPAVGAALRIG
jgi:catechol 2,3-dioxygenase-like lactoylglutathione lyase family enzyme